MKKFVNVLASIIFDEKVKKISEKKDRILNLANSAWI